MFDRGYRGKREVIGTQIILFGKALKKDSRNQKDKKLKKCRKRAAIEPIGHLKSNYCMASNYLKGALDEHINLLMATGHILALFPVEKTAGFANSFMEKIKSFQFTFCRRPSFGTAALRKRLTGIF
uniref:hypothetical protein n=1 Tax=Nitrosomonas supralitoralis TaxID=2116706 RepID=UPI001F5B1E8F|nr:hypothetical protein [Nitrosomonas supralitoralis]